MSYNTRSGRSSSGKLDDIKQLPSSASEFYPIHRRSLNLKYVNADNANILFNVVSPSIKPSNYLLISNLTRDELSLAGHRSDILDKLADDDEKTLALYLYKVIQNDPLTTDTHSF
ncbi:hypothetical protein K7432_017420 [Basidiobolus ranarum]|uniref:Uncharacterized protein n=1 Tax=Basidiobolus ranarum TaxID=34480 RepID=A0ABR2VKF1_9FUNG